MLESQPTLCSFFYVRESGKIAYCGSADLKEAEDGPYLENLSKKLELSRARPSFFLADAAAGPNA